MSSDIIFNQEEIEEVDITKLSYQNSTVSTIETWCNTFAYYLLLGKEKAQILDSIDRFDTYNDYGHDIIKQISKETNLSRLAIYTNLLIQKKISYGSYLNIKEEMEKQWQQRLQEKALQKEQDKLNGKEVRGRNPQPIRAELVKTSFHLP